MLSLLSALSPVRLGLTLLVISRPRSVPNLLLYWLGCLTGCIPGVLLPLTLVHITPMSDALKQDGAATSSVRNFQFVLGVLALSIAALMTMRALRRRRQRALLPTTRDAASTLVLDPKAPTDISRLLGRAQDEPTEGGSAFRRMRRRIYKAWEDGSLWVAFVIGMVFGGAQPDEALFVVAVIVASGAAIGTQVSAAIVFIVGTLAVVEIILVSYLLTPTRTHSVLRVLHGWAWLYRRRILIAMITVVGLALVTQSLVHT
jgi:hypothetical protein